MNSEEIEAYNAGVNATLSLFLAEHVHLCQHKKDEILGKLLKLTESE